MADVTLRSSTAGLDPMGSHLLTTPASRRQLERLPRCLEALERLKYVAESRTIGLLSGPEGVGKTRLLRTVADELGRAAVRVTFCDAAGWSAEEWPSQIARKLGLGLPLHSSLLQVWTRLEQYFVAQRDLAHPQLLIVDHVDLSPQCSGPLGRLLNLLDGTFSCLLAAREPADHELAQLAGRFCPLRISLAPLTAEETGAYIAADRSLTRRFPAVAVDSLHDLSRGKLRSVDRLTQFVLHAAEIDDIEAVDSPILQAAATELRL